MTDAPATGTDPAGAAGAGELSIEIDASVARGLYSNVVLISRSTRELTLDFAYLQPNATVMVQARIIVTPDHARELIETLTEQLRELDADLAGA